MPGERVTARFGAALLRLVAVVALFAVAASVPLAAKVSTDVRLIMVDDPACHYCRKWDAEIGAGYPRSAEGRFAPLVRVRRGAPELEGLAPVVYTPTFIVMRVGREAGRVAGYPGRDYFYGELRLILEEIGFRPGS